MYIYDRQKSDGRHSGIGDFSTWRSSLLASARGASVSYFGVPPEGTSTASPTTLPNKPPRPFLVLERFKIDEASLIAGHKEKLNGLAEHIVRTWRSPLPIRRIWLVGHTDDTGDPSYNIGLGQRRAESVKAELAPLIELWSRQLPSGTDKRISIDTETRGLTKPVTRDRSKRELNRRVEVFLFVSRTKPTQQTPEPHITGGQPPIVVPPITVQPPEPEIPRPQWSPPRPGTPPKPWTPWPWWPTGAPPPATSNGGGWASAIGDWLKTSLTAAAGALGIVISGGVWTLRRVTVQKAIEAAWLVFQIEQGGLRAIVGLAGERALEAILPDIFGLAPESVFNLNNLLEVDFPVLDLITPRGVFSVKTYGIVSSTVGKELESAILSKYKNDFLRMVLGGQHHPAADSPLDKCAKYLFENQQWLRQKGLWPKGLRGTSEQQIRTYVQREAGMVIPADHLQMVRKEIGKHLNQLRVSGKIQADPKWIQDQTFRILPGGVKSTDLSVMVDVASRHLPKEQNERLWKEYGELIRRRRARQRRK